MRTRWLCLLAGLLLAAFPLTAQLDSLGVPLPEDGCAMGLTGDGALMYVPTLDGGLYRYTVGEGAVEAVPVRRAADSAGSMTACCEINGGVYMRYHGEPDLHLVYAERDGLPDAIRLPLQRDVKGAQDAGYVQQLHFDGAAVWFLLDARGNETYALCRYDIERDKVTAFENSRGLYTYCLLPDGRAVLGDSMYVKEKVFGRLRVLDTATGAIAGSVDIGERPEAMAWAQERGALLYLSESQLWSWPLSGRPAALRRMPVNGNGLASNAIVAGGRHVSVHGKGLFLADPDARQAGSLRILGEIPSFSYEGGVYDTYMSLRPDVDLSFQRQAVPGESIHTGELGMRIQTGTLSFDVMLMSTQEYDLDALIRKGYCLDLSGEPDLVDAVGRMYPAIARQVIRDGRLYGIPLMVSGMNPMCWNTESLRMAGMTPDDLPRSVEGVVDWIRNWPRGLRDQLRPLPVDDVAELLRDRFITRFIADQLSRGQPLDFADPVFASTLEAIDAQRFPVWQGPMPFVLSDNGSDLFGGNVLTLSLTDSGRPVESARMFLYVVNSQTNSPQLAIDYVRAALEHSPPQCRASLYPSWTQPVEQAGYADWLAQMAAQEQQLRQAVGAARGNAAKARAAQQQLDAHLAAVERQRPYQQYRISPEALAHYQQAVAPNLFFPPINPFTSWREPGAEGIRSDIRRYMKGQINARALAQSLQQKARLMQLEGME